MTENLSNYVVRNRLICLNDRDRHEWRFAGFIHEGFEGYQGSQLQPFKYDPDMAKKLLAEAGYTFDVCRPSETE